MQIETEQFFEENKIILFNNVLGLMKILNIDYNQQNWRLFVDAF